MKFKLFYWNYSLYGQRYAVSILYTKFNYRAGTMAGHNIITSAIFLHRCITYMDGCTLNEKDVRKRKILKARAINIPKLKNHNKKSDEMEMNANKFLYLKCNKIWGQFMLNLFIIQIFIILNRNLHGIAKNPIPFANLRRKI